MKYTAAILAGIFIGAIATFTFSLYKNPHIFFKPVEIKINHADIVDRSRYIGIEIPPKAYDIDFYYICFLDHTLFLAFSANNEEIDKALSHIKNINQSMSPNQKVIPCIPKNKNGKDVINWWPKNYENLGVTLGDLIWIGHDRQTGRVYVYSVGI